MLSDALALVIGLFTAIISKRKSTKNTFGWVRAEVLGPLINSVFLVSLCIGIVIEAVERLFEPRKIEDIDLLLYVGLIGLIINLAGLVLFGHGHNHSHGPHGQDLNEDDDESGSDSDSDGEDELESIKCIELNENQLNNLKENSKQTDSATADQNPLVKSAANNDESEPNKVKKRTRSNSPSKKARCHILSKEANMNMRAVFLHVLADALGSVIVIISALLNKFQNELKIPEKLINLADPVLCLCLVALILSSTLPLLKESALILLQTVPKEIQVKQLKHDLVHTISGVSSVHELHIWKLSGKKIIATAHVRCHNTEEYMQIATKIKAFFHQKGIHSTTIQPEFTNEIETHDNCILECEKDCVQNTCCGQTNSPANVPNAAGTTNTNQARNEAQTLDVMDGQV